MRHKFETRQYTLIIYALTCLSQWLMSQWYIIEYYEYIIGKYLKPTMWVEQVGYAYIVGLPLGHE